MRDLINPASASRLVYRTLANASDTVTMGFLVLLIVPFMLAEASSLPEKLRAAFSLIRAGEEQLVRLFNSINRYMLIKTVLSIATGVGVWIWLRIIGIEYAVALAIAVTAFTEMAGTFKKDDIVGMITETDRWRDLSLDVKGCLA